MLGKKRMKKSSSYGWEWNLGDNLTSRKKSESSCRRTNDEGRPLEGLIPETMVAPSIGPEEGIQTSEGRRGRIEGRRIRNGIMKRTALSISGRDHNGDC